MTYQPNEPAVTSLISREEFNDLTDALKQLLMQSPPSIDVALQPTVIVLEKLVTAQQSLRKELGQQQEIIKKQSIEIKELKNQSQHHSSWLTAHLNRKTIGISLLLAVVALAILITGYQKIVPVKIDSEAVDKLNFLYFQELERYKKAKTSRKK